MGNYPSRSVSVFPVTVSERLSESLLYPNKPTTNKPTTNKLEAQEDLILNESRSVSASLRVASDLIESSTPVAQSQDGVKASELLAPVSECFLANPSASLDCWPQVLAFKDQVSQASKLSLQSVA